MRPAWVSEDWMRFELKPNLFDEAWAIDHSHSCENSNLTFEFSHLPIYLLPDVKQMIPILGRILHRFASSRYRNSANIVGKP
jgi:hypothetical protein